MAEFFYSYGLFLLKALSLVAVVVLGVVAAVAALSRNRGSGVDASVDHGHLVIQKLNRQLETMQDALNDSLLEPAARKQAEKARAAEDKAETKAAKRAARRARRLRGKARTVVPETGRRRVFVLDFDGDIRASAVEKMRREITAVLTSARREDEVVVRLESAGGMVVGYGLAAAQLERIREKRIPLTVCVDKVAASGGYLMAVVGNRVIAAPFAILGSIGVVAQIPNLNRFLKEHNVDFELLTAGKYKRTLTVFGENTAEGRQKFIEDLERIHEQFKEFVGRHRPDMDVERVATGEIWSGDDVLELDLADALGTSDQYLVDACRDRDVFLVSYRPKRNLLERISFGLQESIDGVAFRWLDRLLSSKSGLY
ncbi:MAG: protease SohB [Gammaproteobacteria bacterium]|nr:MAG: protease SohB [Gammaproteobacteria bacterium]